MKNEVLIHPTYNGTFMFFCPVCGRGHEFTQASWNGSFNCPTITETLSKCSATVYNGKIQFEGKEIPMEVF